MFYRMMKAGLAVVVAGLLLTSGTGTAEAFWGHRRAVTAYSLPSTPVVAAMPVVAAYAPAPVVAAYAPAPVVVARPVFAAPIVTANYAPVAAPVTSYYAPATTAYYAPPATVAAP